MKVAIFGASGLVGRNLGDYLTEKKIEWIGTYNKNQCNNSIFVDITKQESISQFLLENNITHCVNSIAERNVDLCEKQWDTSYEINCRVALRIATACKTHSISFLHISHMLLIFLELYLLDSNERILCSLFLYFNLIVFAYSRKSSGK